MCGGVGQGDLVELGKRKCGDTSKLGTSWECRNETAWHWCRSFALSALAEPPSCCADERACTSGIQLVYNLRRRQPLARLLFRIDVVVAVVSVTLALARFIDKCKHIHCAAFTTGCWESLVDVAVLALGVLKIFLTIAVIWVTIDLEYSARSTYAVLREWADFACFDTNARLRNNDIVDDAADALEPDERTTFALIIVKVQGLQGLVYYAGQVASWLRNICTRPQGARQRDRVLRAQILEPWATPLPDIASTLLAASKDREDTVEIFEGLERLRAAFTNATVHLNGLQRTEAGEAIPCVSARCRIGDTSAALEPGASEGGGGNGPAPALPPFGDLLLVDEGLLVLVLVIVGCLVGAVIASLLVLRVDWSCLGQCCKAPHQPDDPASEPGPPPAAERRSAALDKPAPLMMQPRPRSAPPLRFAHGSSLGMPLPSHRYAPRPMGRGPRRAGLATAGYRLRTRADPYRV